MLWHHCSHFIFGNFLKIKRSSVRSLRMSLEWGWLWQAGSCCILSGTTLVHSENRSRHGNFSGEWVCKIPRIQHLASHFWLCHQGWQSPCNPEHQQHQGVAFTFWTTKGHGHPLPMAITVTQRTSSSESAQLATGLGVQRIRFIQARFLCTSCTCKKRCSKSRTQHLAVQ